MDGNQYKKSNINAVIKTILGETLSKKVNDRGCRLEKAVGKKKLPSLKAGWNIEWSFEWKGK